MPLYRLHVKKDVECPEDWSRVLVPFAGTGLRLVEEFKFDCVIDASPILLQQIMSQLGEWIESHNYDPSERDRVSKWDEDEAYSW
jgi:hypothetical protein